ncbi:hypothetical protein ACRAWG_01585 [Methylobacterium sp. P31]
MAFPRDWTGFEPGATTEMAWSRLGPYGASRARGTIYASRRRSAARPMPKLGRAAIPWILLVLLAPVVGEQIKLPGIDKLAWLCSDLAALCFLVLRRDLASTLFGSRPLLLAWPALAVASATWSLTPGISVYHGFQLLATIVAGIALRTTMGLSRIVRITFLALLCGEILSVVLTVVAPSLTRGMNGDWAGIYAHKNVLGGLMSLQLICAACLFLQGWQRLLTAAAFSSP